MRKDLVSLRRMTDDDYDLLVSWLDGKAGAYANGGPEYTSGPEFKEASRKQGHTHLMVVTGDDEPIGATSWRTQGCPGNYSVGLVIGHPERWARGYGAVATSLLFRHLFHNRNARRVEVMTGTFNRETMKLITRGMMTLEGVLRDYAFVDGEYHDVAICSLLRDEYYAQVEKGVYGPQRDLIERSEKDEAKQILLSHLTRSGDSHLTNLLNRTVPDVSRV